jgi:hypothetical protein
LSVGTVEALLEVQAARVVEAIKTPITLAPSLLVWDLR